MGYRDFLDAFDKVCAEHLQRDRARAFAFVFYDMTHDVIREALEQASGFRRLDDKTSKDITLFYLHANAVDLYGYDFNLKFMQILGIEDQAQIPCMVFFRVTGGNIDDISIYHIDDKSADAVLLIAELEKYVDETIDKLNAEGDISGLTSSLISIASFIMKLRAFLP